MKTFPGKFWYSVIQWWRQFNWPLARSLARVLVICLLMVITFTASTPPPGDLYTNAAAHARDYLFNYVGWEVNALTAKADEALFGVAPYLDETTRSDIVRAYMAELRDLRQQESAIEQVYADPAIEDPDAVTADLRAERDRLRADLQTRQGMVESILEGQISAVLVDEGLAFLGQVLPPVAMRFTPLPDVLIISPRDEIRVAASLTLNALTVDRRAALEDAVDRDLDVSSLVVDIGGMALYPSMVGEADSLVWEIETASHEWVHHYLFFFPLGLNYLDDSSPETRTINETTADLLGKEIAGEVVRRYYPELPPPTLPTFREEEAVSSASPPSAPAPDVFDFTAAMHETRITVDELLAAGRIEEAEAYMEARRALFNEHGYSIRKINQAYFAFYGGYQAEDAGYGTAGDDPIGPAVIELRARSESLADFLATIRGITTTDELLAAVEAARGQ